VEREEERWDGRSEEWKGGKRAVRRRVEGCGLRVFNIAKMAPPVDERSAEIH
jgi:hypothetical protein